MTLFFSYWQISVLAILLLGQQVELTPCCLRTQPLEAMADGLHLLQQLTSNRHEEFRFLPISLLRDSGRREVVYSVARIILKTVNNEDGNMCSAANPVVDSISRNLCDYVEILDNSFMNCSIASIEDLAGKIELYKSVKSLFRIMYRLQALGSEDNRFQYWNKYVETPCSNQSCPGIDEIKKEVIAFSPNSNECSC